jgi:uncharacterized protein YcbK (DUF882 family)
MSITVILPLAIVPAAAASERALYLYYTHTKETARIVFKRNGQYVQSGLNELNQFLRDWRRNEPTKMDPRLFDLVWEVYQEVGGTQPVNIVSAYRSPATNAQLAANSSGVADNSQHMRGTAMDFFIPGVPLARLRATAMRKQVGGVGYYPTSGSPFVHLDTGSVRAWPRMTRAQLKDIFPDGRTMHVPTDGKPLSQEGYQVAMAEWKRCHAYPCNGGSSSGTQVAENGGSGKTLMDLFFGGGEGSPAAAPAPGPTQVAAAAAAQPSSPIAPPIPALRPATLGGTALPLEVAAAPAMGAIPFATTGSAPLDPAELTSGSVAPFPVMKSQALQVATSAALPAGDAVTALAALTAPVPQPRLIMTDQQQSETVTAYLPAQDPEAQRALEMIIQRETTASAPPPSPATRLAILPPLTAATGLRTASLGSQPATGALANLFSGTFGAARQNEPVAMALAEHIARRPVADDMRRPDLIAPDLEHVAEVFTAPAVMTSSHFAVIWDHDEADFDPTAELGRFVTVMGVGDFPAGLSHTRFVSALPIALASN